jgi:hypothetical protein
VLAILWFSGDRRRKAETDVDTRLYRALLLSTAAMAVFDSIDLHLNGKPGALSRALNK